MSKALPIVFDNGSGYFKAGFSEDFTPQISFPTVVGTPKNPNFMIGMDQKDFYVGNEVNSKINLLNTSYPVQKGCITDWNKMAQIWEYTYENELIVDPSEHPILLTEPPNPPKNYKEKMADLFFNKFKVEQFYASVTAVLSLYAIGKTTGLVLESGAGITHSVPIYEGFAIPYATIRLDISGKDLTNYLMDSLRKGTNISTQDLDFDTFAKLKEEKCYVAYDYDATIKEHQKKGKDELAVILPDGTELNISDETFKIPEILFQPNKVDKDFFGIHEAVYQSILRCKSAISKDLYGNIFLSGGNTMFKGISNRLFKEISALAPNTITVKTKAPQERKSSVWIGGSILTGLSSFKNMWISQKDYNECGESIIARKMF